jgi:hypothetical protein
MSIFLEDLNESPSRSGRYRPSGNLELLGGLMVLNDQSVEDIESGLTNSDKTIRQIFAAKRNFKMTNEQFERGLSDSSAFVRGVFAKRLDVSPTSVQVERGLTDDSETVQ